MSTNLEREGRQWLARQLAWEDQLDELRRIFRAGLDATDDIDSEDREDIAA